MNPAISEESLQRKLLIFGKPRNETEMVKKFIWVEFKEPDPDNDKLAELYQYCQDNFGDNWIWSARPSSEFVRIYFLHSEDALQFKLIL